MPIFQNVSKILKPFQLRDFSNPRTPGFAPPGLTDGGYQQEPPADDDMGPAVPGMAQRPPDLPSPPAQPPALATPGPDGTVPVMRPRLAEDEQKLYDAAAAPAPRHPQHGVLRTIGEGLATSFGAPFIGEENMERLLDPKYSAEKRAYQARLEDAARPVQVRQGSEKAAATNYGTLTEARARELAAQNYPLTQTMSAIEHGGELVPENGAPPDLESPREGSTVAVPGSGTKVFFPSRKQQAEDKKAAEQSTWNAVTEEMAAALSDLGVKAGDRVPPSVFNQYQRIIQQQTREPKLNFQHFVNENTGDVTMIGFDPVSGEEKKRQVIQGVAAKRPTVTQQNRDIEADAIEAAAQALAAGELTPLRAISSTRGSQRLLIFKRAKEINPNFNSGEIDRKIAMQNSVDNGADGKNLQSFDQFLQHSANAVDMFKQLQQTNSQILNKPLNWIRANAKSSPEYRRVLAALEPVKKEYETFLLNNRALYESDRKSADAIINEDVPVADFIAAVQTMAHTAEARVVGFNNRYRRVMGKDLPPDTFSQEALTGAAKLGVRLPGNSAQPPAAGIPQAKTKAEYDALPSGTKYIGPDGLTAIKR